MRESVGSRPGSLAACLLLLALAAPAAAQTWGGSGFTVTPLPFGFYAAFQGNNVNDAGQVAGYLLGQPDVAALYDGSSLQNLGTLGGSFSEAYGVNAAGQVVGESMTTTSGVYHAFLYDAGSMQDLGTLGGDFSTAYAVNSTGEIAGESSVIAASQPYLYDSGGMHDLGTLGGPLGQAFALNDAGQVVGEAYTSANSPHAFLYNGGVMQDLGTLGGSESIAYGINNSGQVTGWALTAGDTQARAFLYDGGAMQDLGTLGGTQSRANSISDAGVVVGVAADATQTMRAALWEGGTAYSLSDIVGQGWSFTNATISPGGTILAFGSQNGGGVRLAVLKPNPSTATVTPEPPSLLLLVTGLIGVAGVAARRRRGSSIG